MVKSAAQRALERLPSKCAVIINEAVHFILAGASAPAPAPWMGATFVDMWNYNHGVRPHEVHIMLWGVSHGWDTIPEELWPNQESFTLLQNLTLTLTVEAFSLAEAVRVAQSRVIEVIENTPILLDGEPTPNLGYFLHVLVVF